MKKIKCNNINYRKGYIEVIPNIHDGCVNLEIWDVHVDVDLSKTELGDDDFPEDGITANTEIELNVKEVEELITQLQSALKEAKEVASQQP